MFGWLIQLLDQIAGPAQFTRLFPWSRSMTVLLQTTACIRSKSFVWSVAEIKEPAAVILIAQQQDKQWSQILY
jgi:hypothetical protein